jgi:hypothetical protein
MAAMKKILFFPVKVALVCAISVVATFFISLLAGEDLSNINHNISELSQTASILKKELDTGIDFKIRSLGDVPAIEPYKRLYCEDLAAIILRVYYSAEKQKILFDTYNPAFYEAKSTRLLMFAMESDIDQLLKELDMAKVEVLNAMKHCEKRLKKLSTQRIAYVALFFILAIVLYYFLFFRHDRR